MSAVHGRFTVLTVDGIDISRVCKTSSFEGSATVHKNTGYGVDDETKNGGLRDRKFTCGGSYDDSEDDGPGFIDDLLGTTVPLVRKLEGPGTGKPQDAFVAVVSKFVTTAPVDDNVSWSAEFEVSGPVTKTPQA